MNTYVHTLTRTAGRSRGRVRRALARLVNTRDRIVDRLCDPQRWERVNVDGELGPWRRLENDEPWTPVHDDGSRELALPAPPVRSRLDTSPDLATRRVDPTDREPLTPDPSDAGRFTLEERS